MVGDVRSMDVLIDAIDNEIDDASDASDDAVELDLESYDPEDIDLSISTIMYSIETDSVKAVMVQTQCSIKMAMAMLLLCKGDVVRTIEELKT